MKKNRNTDQTTQKETKIRKEQKTHGKSFENSDKTTKNTEKCTQKTLRKDKEITTSDKETLNEGHTQQT